MSSSNHKSVFQVDIFFHHFSPTDDSYVKTRERDKGQAHVQAQAQAQVK